MDMLLGESFCEADLVIEVRYSRCYNSRYMILIMMSVGIIASSFDEDW